MSIRCWIFCPFVIYMCVLSFVFPSVEAQYAISSVYEIRVEGDPQIGNDVEVFLESVTEPVQSIRSITWFVNGKQILSGKNTSSTEFKVRSNPTVIHADVIYFDVLGARRSVRIVKKILPIAFDVLWEGDTAVIPGYRGHRLVGPEAPVILSAHINFLYKDTLYTEEDFFFRWLVDFEYLPEQGPGVSVVTIPNGPEPLRKLLSVEVEASLVQDLSQTFTKSILIPVTEPILQSYIHSTLYGLQYRSTVPEDATLLETSTTLSVYPFFMSEDDFEVDAIQYDWFINNSPSPSKSGRRITVSAEGESVTIPFIIRAFNRNNNLQKSDISFSLNL